MPKPLFNNATDGSVEEQALALTVSDNAGAVILQTSSTAPQTSGSAWIRTGTTGISSTVAVLTAEVGSDASGANHGIYGKISDNSIFGFAGVVGESSGSNGRGGAFYNTSSITPGTALYADSTRGTALSVVSGAVSTGIYAVTIFPTGAGGSLWISTSTGTSTTALISNTNAGSGVTGLRINTNGGRGLHVNATNKAAYFIGSDSNGAVEMETAAANPALKVSGTNAIDTGATVQVTHSGLGTGLRVDTTGTGVAAVSTSTGSGFSAAVLTQSGSAGRAALVTLSNASNASNAMQIDSAGTGAALRVNSTNNSGTPIQTNTTSNSSTKFGVEVTAVDSAGGVKITSGSGSTRGPALQVIQNSGTERFRVEDDGVISGLNSQNFAFNGAFDVWQRGTSFAVGSGVENKFTADRWAYYKDGTGTGTISRQAFTLGAGPPLSDGAVESPYFLRYVRSVAGSGATANTLMQKIPGVRTLAGKKFTLSVWIKADANRTVIPIIRQYFGSGGSPSASVDISGSWAVTTTLTRFTFSGTLASISGKTLGTDGLDALVIRFELPLNTTFTIEFSQVQLEEGSVATNFKYEPFEITRLRCLPFYQKSFAYDTAPAQAAGAANSLRVPQAVAGAVSQTLPSMMYRIPMRSDPVVTFYNPNAANAFMRNNNTGTDATTTATNNASGSDSLAITVTPPAGSAVGNTLQVHWTAEAELF